MAYVITGAADEAEDAAQDAFVKAFYALARFREGAPFRPWILRIVANEARNRRKAAGRRARLALRASDPREAVAWPAAAPSPEAEALAADRRAALLALVDGLADADRLVIACRYWLELSEAESAEVLACAPGTVKSRLSRALGRLRGAPGIERLAPTGGRAADDRSRSFDASEGGGHA